MTIECAIEAQGSLVAMAARYHIKSRAPTPTRGEITSFSDRSRGRLMRKMARLNQQQATFITLTYPNRFPTNERAREHRRAFLERVRRLFPKASGIWKLEYQERGAPHFHLLFFNMPFWKHSAIVSAWGEIIHEYVDQWQPRVNVQWLRGTRRVMYYVSKYIAKTQGGDEDGRVSGYLIHVPYLHTGRFWGIHNATALPWPVAVKIVLSSVSIEQFEAAKRVMRREWAGFNDNVGKGGTIFSDIAYIVLSELETELTQC